MTQDAFVKAYRTLDRFQLEAPFLPWLLRIVRNEALNRVRSTKRRERLALEVTRDPVSGDAASSPETEVMWQEERGHLLGLIEDLPERYRSVLYCRHLLDLSEEETSAILGLPVGTVKSRNSRALQRLRKTLAEYRAPK